MASEATLQAAFRATPTELEIDYAVVNTGREGLFVVDVSISVTSAGTVVRTGVPRTELTEDRRVMLLSRLTQIDPARSYAAPPQAYAAFLEPGATRKISATLPFPLAPGNAPPSQEVQEILCEKLTFILGVVPAPAVPSAREQEVGGVKLWRLPLDAWRHQRELRIDASVPHLRVLYPK